jgi:hypothetical protein
LRKEHFSLIIEFVNSKMINKLIKNDLLNNYSHRVCEYFEKECKIKQCFRCQKYDHVNKICRTMRNAIFVRASILRSNARHSTNTKNVLIASTSILREVFSATLKRKKSRNSTRFKTTNHSCISKHHQMKTQRRQKIDLTSLRLSRCARSLRLNKRWIFRHNKARNMTSRWWVSIWTKTLTNFSFFSQLTISAIIHRNQQSSRRRRFDALSASCK